MRRSARTRAPRPSSAARPAHYPGPVSRLVSVYPLVTARALARPFTYEAPDAVGKGAVVSIPFGRGRQRGVVVGIEQEAPAGVEPVPVGEVLDELPPALVDLALWVGDYYGSTPARALALVAPAKRKRRKEQAPPAERQELAGEAEPARLSEPQELAVGRVVQAMDAGGAHMLLWGATGSGKTEVYLQAWAAALDRGLGAIVLVPEIALAPQTVGRVRTRFGDRVAILHSALTEAERRDERERIVSGAAPIVVGARSAIFAPLPRVGLICVDEEHDASYKQESDPRYDARTVAAKRAALEGAVALYGSATPRPESWASLERLVLGGRIAGPLPPVRVVDLRREAGYPLSAPLLEELGAVARKGGKAILLLNRRGLAPALHCRACGATRRCPSCDVALVLHEAGGRGAADLRCHHCGHREAKPEVCPECGSAELARLGAGTQRLERELAKGFPELELVRLDADTTGKPEALAAALRRFAATDRAVLLGTQMVAKGHHFANVALAAVVDADTGLALPDFRAEERTFQLLTQLAGRSGRDAPGRVVVQTFQPDARPIVLAANHDVERFLTGELERREALGYPPYRHLVRIVATGPEPAAPLKALEELRDAMPEADLLGPAPLLRLRGRHRAQLVAKTDAPRAVAAHAARLLAAAAPALRRAGLTTVVDVDPQSL
jgi:primosomal protein N' (replication factor Y) (superfamily II helicase)